VIAIIAGNRLGFDPIQSCDTFAVINGRACLYGDGIRAMVLASGLAADINDTMASYAIARMQDMLNEQSISLRGAKILCLGAAFKRGVSDVRNSRAIHVMELLVERGAVVSYCDPHVPEARVGGRLLQSISLDEVHSTDADLVAVLVAGNWPLDALAQREVSVFDAVNAGGAPGTHRQRL
jgi:UDP-N-acetyl-D-glucosamine dehydrogenase